MAVKPINFSKDVEEAASKFGLHGGLTEAYFWESTKTGKLIVTEIIKGIIAKKEKEEEQIKILLAEQQEKELSALLSRMEAEEEDEVKEKWWLHQEVKKEPPQKPQPSEPSSTPSKIASEIDKQIKKLESEINKIQQDIKNTTELYANYDKNIKEVDDFISTLYPENQKKTIEALEDKIKLLEGTQEERNAEADAIRQLVDDGKDSEAKSRLNNLNAKNLQIGTLKDMLAVIKGDKHMYNMEGKPVHSFKEADFVVPQDKKIVKEGNDYYLLGKGDNLSGANREAAKQDFERSKAEMSSVKNLVNSNRGIEMTAFNAEVLRISAVINKLQNDKAAVLKAPVLSNSSDTTVNAPPALPSDYTSQQTSKSDTASKSTEKSEPESVTPKTESVRNFV